MKPIEKGQWGQKMEINLTVIQYTIKSTKNTEYVFMKIKKIHKCTSYTSRTIF